MTPAAAVLLVLLAAPPPAGAAAALAEAREAYQSLDLARAFELLEGLRQGPELPLGVQAGRLELLAFCLVAAGEVDAAVAAFEALLALVPEAALDPEVSPKIEEAFNVARARVFQPDQVDLHLLDGEAQPPRLRLVDPWRKVKGLSLFYRPEADRDWTTRALAPAPGIFELPLDARRHGNPSWYLEARGAQQEVLARVGDAQAPLALPRPSTGDAVAPRRGPVLAAAGAAVGLAVLGTAAQVASSRTAAEGHGQAWADDALRLEQRSRSQAYLAAGLFGGAVVSGAAATALWVW